MTRRRGKDAVRSKRPSTGRQPELGIDDNAKSRSRPTLATKAKQSNTGVNSRVTATPGVKKRKEAIKRFR